MDYRCYTMYECFGYIKLPGQDYFQWVKGFEVGMHTDNSLYVFFVSDNVRQRYYLKESELNYSKEKPE